MCICAEKDKDPRSPRKSAFKPDKPQSDMIISNDPHGIMWNPSQNKWLLAFVDQFWRELEGNSRMLKEAIALVESQANGNGYQELP